LFCFFRERKEKKKEYRAQEKRKEKKKKKRKGITLFLQNTRAKIKLTLHCF
jgi:hypothetical protein